MTGNVLRFAASFGPEGKVLEVGSRDINGSMRNFYADYIGVDTQPGDGVDIVVDGITLPFDNNSFDKVLYLETIEHDLFFWNTMKEITRVLKSGGLLIMTGRGNGFVRHDFPCDYYRFTDDAFRGLLNHFGYVGVSAHEDQTELGVFGSGMKGAK